MGEIFGELNPCEKVTLLKTEGTRSVVKPKLRRLESDEEDLKNKGVRNWRQQSQDRELWRTILEEAKVYQSCNARRRRTKTFCDTLRNRYISREYK